MGFKYLILIIWNLQIVQAIPFESCYDFGSTFKGNCTVIVQDGAIGAESVSSVWIQDGYLDYGPGWGGCPFQNNTCPNGFSYYGWAKFHAYPSSCSEFGVVVSTQVFNIHILGNGHLAVYAWLPNGTEYYAETVEPVMLNIYYPIVVQFQYFSNNGTWRLIVVVMSQLMGGAVTGRPRTYTPPSPNLVWGGSGNGAASHNASVQLDRTVIDVQPQPFDYIYAVLLDIGSRQAYCNIQNGVLVAPLTCYYLVPTMLNWTDAYSACSSYKYGAGYPYSRLAVFPSWNTSIWSKVADKLATYGNGSVTGYNAWLGGGHQLQWLNASMTPTGAAVVVPPGVTSNTSTSSGNTCLQVSTKPSPWQWSETNCSTPQRYVCEMSYDCLVSNPCKNLGTCLPFNDGVNICKCWPGSSGQFCENGIPSVNCINNCPCANPIQIPFGNCSLCESDLNLLMTLIKELTLTSKLLMTKLGNDYEAVEIWNCYVDKAFKNFSSYIQNSTQLPLILCDIITNLYTKFVVQKFAAKQFLTKFSSNLPANITALLQLINATQQSLKSLPCFTDMIKNFKNTTYYNHFKEFYNHIEDEYNRTVCQQEEHKITYDTATNSSSDSDASSSASSSCSSSASSSKDSYTSLSSYSSSQCSSTTVSSSSSSVLDEDI